MKRKQAESERPILPANQKLITLSVQDAPTKKGNECGDAGLEVLSVRNLSLKIYFFFFQSLSSILMGSLKFASCMNTCSGSWRFGLFTTFLIVVSCFEVTEVTGGSGQLLFCGSVTCNMSLLAASNVHLFYVCMWANANTSRSPQFIWLI